MWRGYRGSTWPQVGDYVRVKSSGQVGVVADIVGHGADERFILIIPGARDCRRVYALAAIQRAEPSSIDRL